MKRLIFVLLALVGCDDAELPSCADLGCPLRPSGDPGTWEPCEGDVCFCFVAPPELAVACTPEDQ